MGAMSSSPRCFYCRRRTVPGADLRPDDDPARMLTRDHVFPRCWVRNLLPRPPGLAWCLLNRVPCCRSCNGRKADMDPRDWAKLIDPGRAEALLVRVGRLLEGAAPALA